MTTNVSFALLDGPVIAGRGDEPAVVTQTRTWSHARLLEEVAALGGVLRHLGIGAGVPCVVTLDDDVDAITAALAVARVGGIVATQDDPAAPAVVVTPDSPIGRDRLRLVRGEGPVQEPDLDWVVMLRAGRTDPAPSAVVDPAASYSRDRTVGEQITALEATSAPYDAAELRSLLQV